MSRRYLGAVWFNTVEWNGMDCDTIQLEVFRKTLMQSQQEEDTAQTQETIGKAQTQETICKQLPAKLSVPFQQPGADDDMSPPPLVYSSTQSENVEHGNLLEDREADSSRPRISQGLLLASQTSTLHFTPPGSPPITSASASPTKRSKPPSPRRNSVSFSTTRGMFDSLSSSTNSSFSTSGAGSALGRSRVDGKEFFRQVRSRLSYEQFGAFLANVKELNSHKQTKDETLGRADEIFGPDNKDLLSTFEALLSRNVH